MMGKNAKNEYIYLGIVQFFVVKILGCSHAVLIDQVKKFVDSQLSAVNKDGKSISKLQDKEILLCIN